MGKGEPRPHITAHLLQVTLSSSARLDALAVNHYELQLQFTCGSYVIEGPLSVDVQWNPDHIRCAGRFASPGETRGSRQWVGRCGLNRTSPTSSLASWGNHSGAGNSHTWGPAIYPAAPRPGTTWSPGEHSTWAVGGKMGVPSPCLAKHSLRRDPLVCS